MNGQSKFNWPSEVTPLAAVTPFKWTGKGPNTEVSVQKGAHFVWHYTQRLANWTDCFESVPKTKWKILEVLLATQQRTWWALVGVFQFFLSFHSVSLFLPAAFLTVMDKQPVGRAVCCLFFFFFNEIKLCILSQHTCKLVACKKAFKYFEKKLILLRAQTVTFNKMIFTSVNLQRKSTTTTTKQLHSCT